MKQKHIGIYFFFKTKNPIKKIKTYMIILKIDIIWYLFIVIF